MNLRGVASSVIGGGVLCMLTAGCGGTTEAAAGPVTFGAQPLVVLASTEGTKQVAVRTSPQPPVKGVNVVQLVVTDTTTGAPIDGIAVDAVPWMPSHGHGTSARTLVEPAGGGVYQIDNVYLYMDGSWELRTSLATADGDDSVDPVFDVP